MNDLNIRIGQLEMLLQGVKVVWFGLLALSDDEECPAG
jgi:hypothetical protein